MLMAFSSVRSVNPLPDDAVALIVPSPRIAVTRTPRRHRLTALLLLLLVGTAVHADDGNIEIRSASSELRDGVYYANARIQFQLSDRIEQALASGIALQVSHEFELIRQRRFWLDSEVAELQVVYVLRYNTVSERYTLRNLNTDSQTSFATIFAALNAIGRIDALPLIDSALLAEDSRHRVRVRAEVSIADYPVSLRYLLFWRDDWRVASDWFSWSLAP